MASTTAAGPASVSRTRCCSALLVATIVLAVCENRPWFLGLLIGQAAHVFTDCFDSVGHDAVLPVHDADYTVGMWAYASQEGRYGDAAAYYSSLGGVWDFLWLVLVLTAWRCLRARLLLHHGRARRPRLGLAAPEVPAVRPRDGRALPRVLRLRRVPHLRLVPLGPVHRPRTDVDWRWGGPWWVDKVDLPAIHPWEWVVDTTIGVAGTAFVLWLGWRLIGRRLWNRAAAAEERSPYYRQFAAVQQDTHRTDPDPATS